MGSKLDSKIGLHPIANTCRSCVDTTTCKTSDGGLDAFAIVESSFALVVVFVLSHKNIGPSRALSSKSSPKLSSDHSLRLFDNVSPAAVPHVPSPHGPDAHPPPGTATSSPMLI